MVDGSVHQRLDQEVTAPAGLEPPVDGVGHSAQLRARTYDLVIPSPVGPGYRTASAAGLAAPAPLSVDGHAVSVGVPQHRFVIPWYYMMDDSSIRPYHALFWDTGSSWYFAYGDEVYRELTGSTGSPLGSAGARAPSVELRTAVEEVDLEANVNLLVDTVLQAVGSSAGYARPQAPRLSESAPPRAGEALAASAAPGLELPVPAESWHAPLGEPAAEGLPAQSAGAAPLVLPSHADAAAAGVVGLLAGLALYHLVKKSALLKNRVRGAIAEHVLQRPGSTITEIADAVGVTHQTASYHLRLLQEHGLVLGVERGNKRLYFRNDGSFNQEERGLVAVLRDPESMRVLELIRQNPWIMKNEAAAALGVSRNTLNWHLQKLLGAGLVSEARENGHCFLFCNRRTSDEVLAHVAHKVDARRPDAAAPPPAEVSAPATPAPPSLPTFAAALLGVNVQPGDREG